MLLLSSGLLDEGNDIEINGLRMCMVCREMKPKDELVRAVRIKGESVRVDNTYKAQGRGAYVCKSAECTTQAQKRRVFERAFSCKIDLSVYEEIMQVK